MKLGEGMWTTLSNLPDLFTAGSKLSCRFVAAITMTWSFWSNLLSLPVHGRKKLIKSSSVVTVIHDSFARQGIELIDENNRGLILSSLIEKLFDSLSSHSDKNLFEFSSRFKIKIAVGFISQGLGQHCLSDPWFSSKQNALGYCCPHLLIFLGVL